MRHVRNDGVCPLCRREDESIIHAIFDCPNVKGIWDCSPFANLLLDAPVSSYLLRFVWVKSKKPLYIFEEPWKNRDIGAMGFVRLVRDYKKYSCLVGNTVRAGGSPSRSVWALPAEGRIRINSDAAMLPGEVAGLGSVLRDETGKIVAVGVCRMAGVVDVQLAESFAVRMGLFIARKLELKLIEVECDALSVVNAINSNNVGFGPLDLLYDDIRYLSKLFDFFSCNHVKRGGNCVAHLAARLEVDVGVELLYVDSFPQGISTLAELDLL
ncbi:uncharacterized protein LOC110727702 [Chenopodium quinoa]|uniref:uncharacterized protein LOC110727702 n=1 Tax=Chenopodium quinoa TaxID=63459 RepID=UPI000B772C92|nr:uncharacterized protein LOC110727702 [Chenopodium quinoa]